MGSGLSTSSSPYVILDKFPILPVQFKSFKKSQVLSKSPPSIPCSTFTLSTLGIFLEIRSSDRRLWRRRINIIREQGSRDLGHHIIADVLRTYFLCCHSRVTTCSFGLETRGWLSRLCLLSWLDVLETSPGVSLVGMVVVLVWTFAKLTYFFIWLTSSKCAEITVFSHLIKCWLIW